MPELTIQIPKLHANQKRIVAESDRFNVLNCGRRWGKTVTGIDRAIRGRKGLLKGYPVGWFAPNYKLLKQAFRDLREILKPIEGPGTSEQDKRIELINGSALECWAFDRNPDAGRSRRYGTIVIDEAGHCENLETAWGKAIRPTLTDFQGDAWFISSPNGPSFFKKLFDRGFTRKPGWRAWTQTSYDNPHIKPSEIDSARDDIGDWAFEQEYLAVFHSESTGSLIPDFWIDRMAQVTAAIEDLRQSYAGNKRVLSIDLGEGTGRDRTVLMVLDRLGILNCEASDRVGIPEAAQKANETIRTYGIRQEDIVFDAGGRGKDLPKYLEPYQITEAVPYHGAGKGGPRFKNKRSAMGWRLRQRLEPERPVIQLPIELPPDYKPSIFDPPLITQRPPKIQPPFALPQSRNWWPSLQEELKALRYEMDGPKIALEKKEDMAKHLGRSPDLVDALFMGMSLLGESS